MKKNSETFDKNDSLCTENAFIFDDNINKQDVFDRFLTYRRRMARLGAVQALYLYDMRLKNGLLQSSNNMFQNDNNININALGQEIINFYKSVFFGEQEYGWNKKNKKLDEDFMIEIVNISINSMKEIDNFIQSHLSGNWTIDKLDFVLRAIIRCAIAELLLGEKIEKAVLCSEYTNLAGNLFDRKEIGFINGIVDKLYTSVTKIHPFVNSGVIVNNDQINNK